MSNFQRSLHKAELQLEAIKHFDREVMTSAFYEQRDKLLNTYLSLLRVHREIKKQNAFFSADKAFISNGFPSAEWCNAAAHILANCDEETQAFFLSLSLDNKNELVEAVLRDGGILLGEYFAELPPL